MGNVWEWVADYYAPYTNDESRRTPRVPIRGDERVIRGGAWNASYPRGSGRRSATTTRPTKRSYGIGFRCAK